VIVTEGILLINFVFEEIDQSKKMAIKNKVERLSTYITKMVISALVTFSQISGTRWFTLSLSLILIMINLLLNHISLPYYKEDLNRLNLRFLAFEISIVLTNIGSAIAFENLIHPLQYFTFALLFEFLFLFLLISKFMDDKDLDIVKNLSPSNLNRALSIYSKLNSLLRKPDVNLTNISNKENF